MAEFIQIDRAGRVVIPKTMRDRYALRPGRRIEITDTGEELLLRPEAQGRGVIHHPDGSVEFTGHLPDGFDLVAAIGQMREERAAETLGLP